MDELDAVGHYLRQHDDEFARQSRKRRFRLVASLIFLWGMVAAGTLLPLLIWWLR